MATNKRQLTKDWIQFLKNFRFVEMESDPKTGRLNYKKQPRVQDLVKFLNTSTDYSEEEIRAAIRQSLAPKSTPNSVNVSGLPNSPSKGDDADTGPKALGHSSQSRDLSTWKYYDMTPGDMPQRSRQGPANTDNQIAGNSNTTKTLPHDPNSISDIDYKEVKRDISPKKLPHDPNSISDIDYKEVKQKKGSGKSPRLPVKEDLIDNGGVQLSEPKVEEIFSILTGLSSKGPAIDAQDELSDLDKEDALRNIKRIIRDIMTDSQRKSLWRLLKDVEVVNESQINPADIKELFRVATDRRNTVTGIAKYAKSLRKPKIDLSDLHQSWRDMKYPDDTRDIVSILKNHGFSDKDIRGVFSTVFGVDKDTKEPDVSTSSTVLMKLADMIKKYNLDSDVKKFMSSEYSFTEEIEFTGKMYTEQVRQIFELIVTKDRTERNKLLDSIDSNHLGRKRK